MKTWLMLGMLAFSTAASAAPSGTATDAVRAANDRLKTLMSTPKEDSGAVAREMHALFDVGFLSERALADHWKDMSPQMRKDLVSTLEHIIEKNYLGQLRGNLSYRVDYTGEEAQQDDVLVKTVIRTQQRGRPAKLGVDYRLHADGDRWRIFDVMTDGVSLLHNYRSQFNRIIAKEGVNGLLARMKAKLESSDG